MVNSKTKDSCPNDCYYDVAKQIVKRSKFLWAVDGYIKNAKKVKDSKCVKIWETIQSNEQRHVDMLKKHAGLK